MLISPQKVFEMRSLLSLALVCVMFLPLSAADPVCTCGTDSDVLVAAQVVPQGLRRVDRSVGSAIDEGIRKSNAPAIQKLRIRLTMAIRPEARKAVEAYVLESANAELGMGIASVDAQLTPEQWDKIIDFFLEEVMPILLELLIWLIRGMDAGSAAMPIAA